MPALAVGAIPGSSLVASWWRELHAPPELPLTGEFRAGLAAVLGTIDLTRLGSSLERARERLANLVGDRFTVVVDAEGVRTRGWIRRHEVRWEDAREVVLEPMEAMAVRRVGAALVARRVPVPVISSLAVRVADGLAQPIAEAADRLVTGLPAVLVEIRSTRGEGIALDGPLALVSLLSRGLTEVVMDQAERHDVPICREA